MLQSLNLHKSYGVTPVLSGLSFVLNPGEHVGLVGPNGAGKSTLLRLITGQDRPDAGQVVLSPPGLTLGHLPQTFATDPGLTVGAALAGAQGAFGAARAELDAAETALASNTSPEAVDRYTAALDRFEALGGWERLARAEATLDALGLRYLSLDAPAAALSGGQKTRLGLAALLLGEPDVLLLDEPTNHLDVDALEWLEGWVRAYPGAVLVVSHDRTFLDRTVTRILYLDPEQRAVRSYPGNYSDFAAARAHEHDLHVEAWTRQQEYVGKVSADIARLKGGALAIELNTTARQPGIRKLAKKKARLAKSREHKLERYLDDPDRVEKPKPTWGLKLDFGTPPPAGQAVLSVDGLRFAYPGGPPLLDRVGFGLRHGDRVALVGPNGAGKSTLIRLIEGRLTPDAGSIRLGAGVRLGVLSQEGETLDPARTVLETVLAERAMSKTDARSFLHFFLFAGDAVFRRVGDCSPGERSRLQLARLVLQGCNLLLLDEPLNHLDIEGREHFEAALAAYEGTVLAVAHDRAFVAAFASRILEVRDGTVRERHDLLRTADAV